MSKRPVPTSGRALFAAVDARRSCLKTTHALHREGPVSIIAALTSTIERLTGCAIIDNMVEVSTAGTTGLGTVINNGYETWSRTDKANFAPYKKRIEETLSNITQVWEHATLFVESNHRLRQPPKRHRQSRAFSRDMHQMAAG